MKLHFPDVWYGPEERPLDTVTKIEVRTISNSPGEYFFAAVPHLYSEYESSRKARDLVYSENSFAVKLTPTPNVRAATKQEWDRATYLVTTGRPVYPNGSDLSKGEVEYRGKKFPKTGKYWQSAVLSPGGKWLAAFSYTSEKTKDWFMDGGSVHSGDIFWDLYDTETGEKVFEWRARNVKGPINLSGPVVWLEERYFFLPRDDSAQDFSIITLPAR